MTSPLFKRSVGRGATKTGEEYETYKIRSKPPRRFLVTVSWWMLPLVVFLLGAILFSMRTRDSLEEGAISDRHRPLYQHLADLNFHNVWEELHFDEKLDEEASEQQQLPVDERMDSWRVAPRAIASHAPLDAGDCLEQWIAHGEICSRLDFKSFSRIDGVWTWVNGR